MTILNQCSARTLSLLGTIRKRQVDFIAASSFFILIRFDEKMDSDFFIVPALLSIVAIEPAGENRPTRDTGANQFLCQCAFLAADRHVWRHTGPLLVGSFLPIRQSSLTRFLPLGTSLVPNSLFI